MATKMEVIESNNDNDGLVIDTVKTSVSVHLHPLVILNISDHHTRIAAQNNQAQQVLGVLMGIQDGRRIEVFNSFELIYQPGPHGLILDKDFFTQKLAQFKEVFSTLDPIGWYTTGSVPTREHIAIHKQILEFAETPLFFILNPKPSASLKELPVSVFETYTDIVEGEQRHLFISSPYQIATEEAERIGIDHVANISNSGDTDSTTSDVATHLGGQFNAIRMLLDRVSIIRDYIKTVKSGELPHDHSILRRVSSLCSRLPVVETQSSSNSTQEANDVMLLAYLSSLLKGINSLHEVLDKVNVVYERFGVRRGRGMFY